LEDNDNAIELKCEEYFKAFISFILDDKTQK